jgi:hypothetical protein
MPSIPAKDVIHPPVAIAHMSLADILDALVQEGRIGATGLVAVVVGLVIEVQCRPCLADRHLPVLPNRVDKLALPIRP